MWFQILLGKLTVFLLQTILKRNASTWPGHVALESNPEFIRQLLQKNKNLQLILIAGTNGKTTTTKALDHIMTANNVSAIRNDSGANLLNGLASLLIKKSTIQGRINKQAILFEVDENALPLVLSQITKNSSPITIILLNLFRDQLDRYGEINTTAEKWRDALRSLPEDTLIIANADDPQIVSITKTAKGIVHYFTISDKLKTEKKLSHAVDSTTCPKCSHELKYGKIAYSHLGNYKCPHCGFSNPRSISREIQTNLKGTFNLYNLTAALITAKESFNIPEEVATEELKSFQPAFGRQEVIEKNDKKVIILLSKNPTGFNESLKVVIENKYSHLLLLLNDRIPDGRDISWIWDVDFELLAKKKLSITVSGDRTYDLANRLQYAGINDIQAKPNPNSALQNALKKTPTNQTLAILATYSAMLEVRKHLTGKSIL